jgi:hypothetical protein
MMRLRVTATTLVLAGVLAGALTTGTAAAQPTPPTGQVGCSGTSCFAQLEQLITFTGPGTAGAANSNVSLANVPIPACWMEPTFTAAQMLAFYQEMATNPIYELEIVSFSPFYPQIKQYAANNTPGQWWAPMGNPNDGNNVSCVAGLPVLEWVPPGAAPAVVANIPLGTLALLALARFHVPAPAVTLNPNPPQHSYVNLPTFVTVGNPPGGLWVTATLGAQQATVTATPTSVNIPNPPGATAYTAGCKAGGSTESAAAMDSAGAGATPDCGVVYQAPSTNGDYPLSVTQTWHPIGYAGAYQAAPAGPDLLPAGTADLQSPAALTPVPVAEIQSVNGTG